MKKNLTKLFALLLVLAMLTVMFAGCKGNEEPTTPDNSGEPSSESTPSENNNDTAKGSVYYLNFKPEFDEALTKLAATYTEKTGVEVKVVTAASGDYNNTLTANIGDVTVFNIGNTAALNDWDEYALDLTDSAIAKELNTDAFNLYNAEGKLKAIGNCYESFGIIVNKALLEKAGHSIDEITNFETLKAVADDIHARAAELGFDAFSSAGLDGSSSWRFSGHLANMPLFYEFRDDNVTAQPAAITGKYLDNYKAIWDLYTTDTATTGAALITATSDMSSGEFKEGKAVFYQNGTWEYAGLVEAGLKPEDLAMIPIYCGVEGEEKAGLCCGTENCWSVNKEASEENIQATLDFMKWVVTSEEGTTMLAEQFGPCPFKSAKTPENVFFAQANDYITNGNYVVTWAFNYTPAVEDWRAGVVDALSKYVTGGSWDDVKTAFVDGWAAQYAAEHAA